MGDLEVLVLHPLWFSKKEKKKDIRNFRARQLRFLAMNRTLFILSFAYCIFTCSCNKNMVCVFIFNIIGGDVKLDVADLKY